MAKTMAMPEEKITASSEIPSEEELLKQIMLTVDTVWGNKISMNEIERWLQNFKGLFFPINYERRLALYLLANFVYYNEAEVRHLCKTLFNDFLHSMLLHDGSTDLSNMEIQLDSIVRTSAFCPLGKPGESGAFVLYYFRQENQIPTKFISDPSRLPAYVKTIVFVDDVTISGTQAIDYLNNFMDRNKKTMLLTFLSTDDSIQLLEQHKIHVISCIKLDDRSRCFSDKGNLYRDFRNSYDDCKKFALEYGKISLCHQPGVDHHPLGYMDGEYTFGFFYNTPDNTLPIFWAENKGWSPIIKRYDKLKEVLYREYGRYV
jgi:hypothetical protein